MRIQRILNKMRKKNSKKAKNPIRIVNAIKIFTFIGWHLAVFARFSFIFLLFHSIACCYLNQD